MRRCLRSDDDVILPEPSTDLSALIGDDQQDAEEVSGCNASTACHMEVITCRHALCSSLARRTAFVADVYALSQGRWTGW